MYVYINFFLFTFLFPCSSIFSLPSILILLFFLSSTFSLSLPLLLLFPSLPLLSTLFPSPLTQDTLQLSHVVQCLVNQRGKGTAMEPEFFQYLLLILVSICRARPRNLYLVSALVEDEVARQTLQECREKERETSETTEPEVRGMFNKVVPHDNIYSSDQSQYLTPGNKKIVHIIEVCAVVP